MEAKIIINEGLQLKPAEKVIVIEALIKSLDLVDPEIEKAWADEAERRLEAYREGKIKTIRYKELFNES